jgi:cysteinyl-tRNA synthetase
LRTDRDSASGSRRGPAAGARPVHWKTVAAEHAMPPELVFHNTLSRRRERFAPIDRSRVTLYACGPTVYNYAPIGNARPAVLFDLLARVLRRRFPKVVYARNITDVDDKINAAAAAEGVPIDVITARYAAAYHEDMAALGVSPPDIEPRATATIGPIVAMCERLIATGHAYAAEGHVLFAIESFPDYGRLSGRSMKEMIAGARVEVAPYKRHPGDFVLWKPSPPELPGWDSPWGRGRPGWHIECSAMIETHLGRTIDIHAGGNDLVFPHHENEIAQSRCAHDGAELARVWMHNGFVTVEGRKMSKSLGNVHLVHDLRREAPPEALRYLLLSAHYRQPLDWSARALAQARRTLDGLYGVLRDLADVAVERSAIVVPGDVEAALADDLNTPNALAALAAVAAEARRATDAATRARRKAELLGAAELLGLLREDPERWFAAGAGDGPEVARIEALVAERQAAKQARDFARADAIRAELAGLGVAVEDTPAGPRWRRLG